MDETARQFCESLPTWSARERPPRRGTGPKNICPGSTALKLALRVKRQNLAAGDHSDRHVEPFDLELTAHRLEAAELPIKVIKRGWRGHIGMCVDDVDFEIGQAGDGGDCFCRFFRWKAQPLLADIDLDGNAQRPRGVARIDRGGAEIDQGRNEIEYLGVAHRLGSGERAGIDENGRRHARPSQLDGVGGIDHRQHVGPDGQDGARNAQKSKAVAVALQRRADRDSLSHMLSDALRELRNGAEIDLEEIRDVHGGRNRSPKEEVSCW